MGEGFYITDRETEFKLIGAVNGTQVNCNYFYLKMNQIIFDLLYNVTINLGFSYVWKMSDADYVLWPYDSMQGIDN